ncbi:MAG: hypothetical protein KAZ45_01095 [Arenimonas sp.]|nr:hypothetical protein [Arenimonas sp.]MBP7917040.1 hypothetical protein [Arenimonas sp.]
MTKAIRLLIFLYIGVTGCSNSPPPEAEQENSAGYQGREDTQSLRNADAVGYDGAAIQKKLDAALDKNDQRAADIDAQIEAQSGSAEAPEQQ